MESRGIRMSMATVPHQLVNLALFISEMSIIEEDLAAWVS